MKFVLHLPQPKRGKAIGHDEIPMEVLQNKECITYLVILYNACFETASIPDVWSHGIIHPIIKDLKTITKILLILEVLPLHL